MISDVQRQRVAEYQARRERYENVRARQAQARFDAGQAVSEKPLLVSHPLYPAVVILPFAILGVTGALDIVRLVTGDGIWSAISFWLIPAGIMGGLAAVVPAAIDWFALSSRSGAKGIGLWFVIGNLVVIGLFLQGWLLRYGSITDPGTSAVVLASMGAGIALLTGWMGGEFLDRLKTAYPVAQQAESWVPRSLRSYRNPPVLETPEIDDEPQRAQA